MSVGDELTITIAGSAGTGKSTLAILLGDFLNHSGFEVDIELLDEQLFEDIYPTLVDRIEDMSDKVKIHIIEKQTKRG